MATCLPVALLYDRIFLTHSWRTTFHQRGIVYFAMLLSFVWLGWAISGSYAQGANATAGFGISHVSAWEYLRSQPAVILHYLQLCVWPATLCLDYGWPIETAGWRIYGLGAMVLVLLLVSLVLLAKRPALGFLGFSFFLILAPTSSIMPIADLAFEHRMYLPLAAVAVLFVLGCEMLMEQYGQTIHACNRLFVCCTLLALPLLMRTATRNVEFRNPERIWLSAIAVNPQHARSHFLLAEHYVRMNRWEDAVLRYRQAIVVRPHYIAAYNNAALALERLGRINAAQGTLREAIGIEPNDPYLHFNLGRLLAQQQDWNAARIAFEKAVQLAPHYANAKQHLAAVIAKQQQASTAS